MTAFTDVLTVDRMTTNTVISATAPTEDVRAAPFDSWATSTLTTIAGIWTAVVVISVFSPDLVSGSEQQHLPVAAFSTWIWGLGSTITSAVALSQLRGDPRRRRFWLLLSATTVAIWGVATVVSLFSPRMVTGSDPTKVPLGALIAPIGAMVVAAIAGAIVLVVERVSRTSAFAAPRAS